MAPSRRVALALTLALAAGLACSAFRSGPPPTISVDPSPPATPAPSASAAAASALSARADAGRPSSPLCAPVLAHNASVIGERQPPGGDAFASPCFPTPGGAWVLRIDRWAPVPAPHSGFEESTGDWTLVHVDRSGAQVAARPGGGIVHQLESGLSYSTTAVSGLFDYDGDGEPEILVHVGHKEHEGEYEGRALVATFQGGAVRELPGLPARYEDFDDVDHDGRLDLLYFPYSMSTAGPCSGFPARDPGPAFVAHSRPDGTFSLDDAVGRAHVENQCPRGARRAGEVRDGGPEPARAELCALFRGATLAQAAAVLDKECRPPGPRDDGCNPPPGVCFDHGDRRGVLSHLPPFRLPR